MGGGHARARAGHDWAVRAGPPKTSKTNQTPLGLGLECLDKGKYRGLGLECLSQSHCKGLG